MLLKQEGIFRRFKDCLEMAVIYEFSKLGKRGRKSRPVGDRIVSSYSLNRHLGTLEKHFH